jgi:hypothetical protein
MVTPGNMKLNGGSVLKSQSVFVHRVGFVGGWTLKSTKMDDVCYCLSD